MPRYRAFGTTIDVNVAIAALEASRLQSDSDTADIHVDLRQGGAAAPDVGAASLSKAETEWHASTPDDAGHVLRVARNDAGDFRFLYTDGTRFVIAADGCSVIGRWPPELSLEDTVEYLLGPVIGFALRRRGVVCLHASAIAVGDECFAVLAPAGHGKSSTAAACARLGLPVLTDDMLALSEREGRFWVLPAYARVRLWPEAVAGLFGSANALPRLTPNNEAWNKRFLDLRAPGYAFQAEPLPLRCIYIPEHEHAPEHEDRARVSFEPIPRPRAFVKLIGNVYSSSRPETAQRAREFDFLERVARSVPVKRFRGRYGIDHLAAQCRTLARDFIGSTAHGLRSAVAAST